MPFYTYEHTGKPCLRGKKFTIKQSIKDEPLKKCPECGRKVRRLISRVNVVVGKSNRELKNLGFTKLKRRDKGVYEDVTGTDVGKQILDANEP